MVTWQMLANQRAILIFLWNTLLTWEGLLEGACLSHGDERSQTAALATQGTLVHRDRHLAHSSINGCLMGSDLTLAIVLVATVDEDSWPAPD